MAHKTLRALITTLISFALLAALLYAGDGLATVISGGAAWGLGPQPEFGLTGWVTWVGGGGVLVLTLYVLVADAQALPFRPRQIGLALLGGILYGILAWIFNIIPVPAISLIVLRPAVVVPLVFGLVGGLIVGFLVGALGNILGDAISGWGTFPIWVVGNGLMGMLPGLSGLPTASSRRQADRVLLGVCLLLAAFGAALPLVSPMITDPFSGGPTDFSRWGYIMLGVVLCLAVLGVYPRAWPWTVILLIGVLMAAGAVDLLNHGFSSGVFVIWSVALASAFMAWTLHRHSGSWAGWLDATRLRTIIAWTSSGIILGMGYAGVADIWYNGYSLKTAIIGEVIPAAGPNLLFGAILAPLLYATWQYALAERAVE